eukprot:415708_1
MATVFLAIFSSIVFTTLDGRCLQTINPNDNILSLMRTAESNNCSIHLTEGTHTITSGWFSFTFYGTKEDPLNIYGDLPIGKTKLHRTTIDQNMLDLSGIYFNVYNLELKGADKGLRLNYKVSHSSFYNLIIHGTNANGLTANSAGPYTYNHFHNIEIYDTWGHGEGMYLGCNSDACDFSYNIIENCYIHDTNSSDGNIQGDGIDLKGGSNNNIIRNNIIVNTIGPGILTYDSYGRGPNLIENNIIYKSGAQGIQITSGQIVRNNVVYTTTTSAFYSHCCNQLKSGTTPSNITVIGNTFISIDNNQNGCIEGRGWDSDNSNSIVFVNNLIICGTENTVQRAIYFNPFSTGIIFMNNAYYGSQTSMNGYTFGYDIKMQILNAISDGIVQFDEMNFYPKQGSVLINGGNGMYSNDLDIDCVNRDDSMPTIGAYEYIEGAMNSRFCLKQLLFGNITNRKCTCNVDVECPLCIGWKTHSPTKYPTFNPTDNPSMTLDPTRSPLIQTDGNNMYQLKYTIFICMGFISWIGLT